MNQLALKLGSVIDNNSKGFLSFQHGMAEVQVGSMGYPSQLTTYNEIVPALSSTSSVNYSMSSFQSKSARNPNSIEIIKSTRAYQIPSSNWKPLCHSSVDEVVREVDAYFLENWRFRDTKDVRAFENAGFSRVTCFYFPFARDDRIRYACRLLTLLFLIDGQ